MYSNAAVTQVYIIINMYFHLKCQVNNENKIKLCTCVKIKYFMWFYELSSMPKED